MNGFEMWCKAKGHEVHRSVHAIKLASWANQYAEHISADLVDQVAKLEAEICKEIGIRDFWIRESTQLAEAVGKFHHFDVGEHSSVNCPVNRAIMFLSRDQS